MERESQSGLNDRPKSCLDHQINLVADRFGRAQSSSSTGPKVPSCNLTSHPLPSSMPLTDPVSNSSSCNMQPASHAPPLSPPSVHPLLVVSSDTLPVSRTTHEVNDLVWSSSTFMSSDPVGCSPAPAPIPLAPSTPVSSRRSGWDVPP